MRISTLAVTCLVALCFASPAMAQKLVANYKDWSVFSHNKLCYIGSSPIANKGNFSRRSDPYVLVTHRSKSVDEVSTSSGYPYKDGVEVTATIDGKKYKMFTQGEIAWAYDEKQDRKMVAAMKKGKRMNIRGTSQKDTWSEDTYSLFGFSAAYKKMKSLCK